MRDQDDLFEALARSPFRQRFRLAPNELEYLREKSLPVVLTHAAKFIAERLAAERPLHDGEQTPMRGHPVFVAQHATATCCRGCLAKWHAIPAGQALDNEQIQHILAVLERWLTSQLNTAPRDPDPSRSMTATRTEPKRDQQRRLFG